MGGGRVVIEHQQNAGNEQNDKKEEGDRAEIGGGPYAEGLLANLDGQPVEEEIAENGEAARAVGPRGAATKDGLPELGLAKPLQRGMKSRGHRSR